MNIILAKHHGMCFGVRDALKATHAAAQHGPTTILGELVHNQVVTDQLDRLGVQRGHLRDLKSASTPGVIITAHGASNADRLTWKNQGHQVTDTTCPLVKKAHAALAMLVGKGYHPVVIGNRDHVEVLGLTGDFPEADVILSSREIGELEPRTKFGVVSQTTQPISRVATLVTALEAHFPNSDVRYVDTVCQPTKDRQTALRDLCQKVDLVIAVGGSNSNNTQQLVTTSNRYGVRAYRVARASELKMEWFDGVENVGVTAGTSTLDATIEEVVEALKKLEPLVLA